MCVDVRGLSLWAGFVCVCRHARFITMSGVCVCRRARFITVGGVCVCVSTCEVYHCERGLCVCVDVRGLSL